MKLRTLLAGLGSLTAAFASAQALPKVQMALITDYGLPSNGGIVHRVDLRTGKYLGFFGAGTLFFPEAVAVQPSTGVAFVSDGQAIRRYNVSTGQFLGNFVRYGTSDQLIGTVVAMRFAPNGDLYTVSKTGGFGPGIPFRYQAARLNGTTGALLGKTGEVRCDFNMNPTIGFRPDGRVEVLNDLGGRTFADTYNANLNLNLGGPSEAVKDSAAFRTSTDMFVRMTNGTLTGALGNFGGGGLIFGSNAITKFACFAEGPQNQTYELLLGTFPNGASFTRMERMDTTASFVPLYGGFFELPNFARGKFTNMAIYAK